MNLLNREINTYSDESNVNSMLLDFLQSDAQIAIQIREIFKNQSVNEIAVNLTKLCNLESKDKEDDLLDKLAEIISKSKTILSVIDTEEDEETYADFSEMANDLEYQKEALQITQDFAYADWEAFQLSEV